MFMTKEVTVSAGKSGEGISQEKLQEKLLLFQLMEKQLEVLRQQGAMAEARMIELETTRAVLRDIERLKEGNETLVPLGSGLHTKARITSKEILTELGANVMLEKDIKTATAFLDERSKELEKAARHIEEQAGEVMESLNELGPELQKMAAQIQKGQ
jgi:prefoldin alpha subunit